MQRPIYVVGDGSFATLELFINSQACGIGLIARMKLNVRLYHLPPKTYSKGKPGPKPPVGKIMLSMEKRLTDRRIKWKSVTFSQWYGNTSQRMLMTSGVAIWRKSNTQLVKVRWGLLKDSDGKL